MGRSQGRRPGLDSGKVTTLYRRKQPTIPVCFVWFFIQYQHRQKSEKNKKTGCCFLRRSKIRSIRFGIVVSLIYSSILFSLSATALDISGSDRGKFFAAQVNVFISTRVCT